MFTSQGIQPVCVGFNNTKNCFLQLPSKLISHLSLNENQALELSWDDGPPVFLSWTQKRTSSSLDDYNVELCRQLGEKLGLKEGEQGFLRACNQVSSLNQVTVEPLSSDDWEILELHSSELEQQLLDQIRVVFQGAVLPVWVDNHTVIYIRVASLSPLVPYGRLEQFTELLVSPKLRAGVGNLPDSSDLNQVVNYSPRSSSETTSSFPHSQQWGGIADLKSLLRHMITGSYDPVKEPPPVPDIPSLFPDSTFRVCNSPPDSPGSISYIPSGVIHMFPWSPALNTSLVGGPSPVTYGLLTKVPSPKEMRDRKKQSVEKKKNGGVGKDGAPGKEGKEEEGQVVRVVCHCIDMLTDSRMCQRNKEIHRGRVWIPEASKLNIPPHSAVRIKPVKTAVKVASNIRLQPLKPLPEESDEEIQAAFLGWLHTQSHQPLACLSERSGSVLLHGNEVKLEFAVTVLKPEPQNDPLDQLFLLTPTVLKKRDIQVDRRPVEMPDGNAVAGEPQTELPSLSLLGGVDELSRAGFEFISHSILGSPLSRELGITGRGLLGGALLITGAKGSGKSTLSRALCRKAREDLDAHVEAVDCKMLQGKKAETVRHILRDVFEQAEWKQPSVVLLDDLDHVTRAPSSPEQEHGPEALLRLHIAQSVMDVVDEVVLDSSLVCLVITSQSEDSLHPALTEVSGSHFIQGTVNIQPPDQAQRADILRHLIQRKSLLSEDTLHSLDLMAVAKETEGFMAQDLALLLERATHAHTVQMGLCDQGACLSYRDFAEALKGFTPPSLWGADLHRPGGAGLERVGGLSEVRQQLMDTILLPAKYPILFSKLPIRHRSGILLYGAPGTGKTLLARAVAKDSGMNFISIKGPELLSKYIGASEQGVRDVFQRAQAAKPCILFFDEFDSLAPRRGHDSTGVTDRVVNQLLTQLDGVEGLQGVYVLAATSRPDLIDPALLRPGRLDKSLYCPPPDHEARVEILRALSEGMPLAPDVDLEQLAALTETFTGADLKGLLYSALLEAVHSRLGTASPHELNSGSDSNMSLSSMIFPNNSSGSEDSAAEGDQRTGLNQSMVLLEPSELHVEDEESHGNIWRLYFGSSYESESGNSPISRPNLPCNSGPNSKTPKFLGASDHEPATTLPPAYMSSIQIGYEELTPEKLERLQEDISNIKKSYKRANEEFVWSHAASSQPSLQLSWAHINSAIAVTRPSLSQADWSRYKKLYEDFGGSGEKKLVPGLRVTLA
ncbi:peroxisomal ATPase PEX1 isoform 1-T1 [Menidia menidia]